MNILDLTAHSIEEYDVVRMFADLGYDVFSPGAYLNPHAPEDDMRGPVPNAPRFPDLEALVRATPVSPDRPSHTWNFKDDLPDEVIEWADTIIVHHVEHRWLWPQWARLRHKRVIWRTVGQSSHPNEFQARPFVADGCEVVRYSPQERNIPNFAGESAMIRFYKDPEEYHGWNGLMRHVLVITQNPIERQAFVGTPWIMEATKGLPVRWVGPQTEQVGGQGKVSPEDLMTEMRHARVILYTGTIPASYTLGLIEAMMTGAPVVAIGPLAWALPAGSTMPYARQMYEGHMIAPLFADAPGEAQAMLNELLNDEGYAAHVGAVSRERAIALFGKDRVYAAWKGWLDEHKVPEPEPDELPDVAREAV